MAVRLLAVQLGPVEPKNGHCGTLEGVLEKRNVEQPVHDRVGVVQMDEEPGEYQERADEEWPEDGSVLKREKKMRFNVFSSSDSCTMC